ncbi:LemA family protein [Sciscionella sediminilitoris]|uniref:LemA family protein n=1 Tax=Sciscionella sediminilitoris TaxID=1445613 RepID=UPI0009EA21A5|nr:LemA family protein [Sciscionella sp. SE31]
MSTGAVIGIIAAVVVLLLIIAVWLISMKNKFVRLNETVRESWRQIDVELERRHTLIGNLVETVKASARFEQQTLTQVVQARSAAIATRGQGPTMQSQAEQQLNGALNHFFQISENYPDLKASADFRALQDQMVECEDRIAAGRRFYNGNVKTYNERFGTFPTSLMSGGYQKADYFQVDDPVVRQAPNMRGMFDDLNGPPQPQFGGPQQQYGAPQGMPQQPPMPQQGMPPQQLPGGPQQQPPQQQPPQQQPYGPGPGQPYPQQGQYPQPGQYPQGQYPQQGQPGYGQQWRG